MAKKDKGNKKVGPPAGFVPPVNVEPRQFLLQPNSELKDRPCVALAAALLTNSITNYSIAGHHKMQPVAVLGSSTGQFIVGSTTMARYVVEKAASGSNHSSLMGTNGSPEDRAMIDLWLEYAAACQDQQAILKTLECALQKSLFLVGSSLTLADLVLFQALGFPTQVSDKANILENAKPYPRAVAWIHSMAACPACQQATQLALSVNNLLAQVDSDVQLDDLAEGMVDLQGALPGHVVTRFPPEPSGYLHVGHSKAVLLNDYYARHYQGRLIVRFDDTNPTKEKAEYQDAIVDDLAQLGVTPDTVSFTSDYFPVILEKAKYLIQNGLAYMDDTPQEQMKEERMNKVESKHRDQTPPQAMEYFELMCSGSKEGAAWCLRAKIDMSSANGTMRDPVLYRQNTSAPHHRSGTTYKAYPTYDLACPIVDSLEGVTHALRTTEYNDRDEQYQWILTALNLRKVRIHAFSRMNFQYTVLSKRKLTWFVEQQLVTGWDDARFPTIRGVVRRGIHVPALRKFIYSQGASRRVVNMEWTKFWAENKKDIDGLAKRYMAIDAEHHKQLTIVNAPTIPSYLTTSCHPKDPAMGNRVIRIGGTVLLETLDTEGMTVGEEIVLLRWGEYLSINLSIGC